MSEDRGIRTLAWSCGGFCTAVFLSVLWLPDGSLPVLALAAAVPGAILLLWRRKPALRAALLFLLFAAGGFLYTAVRARPLAEAEKHAEETVTVEARLLAEPDEYTGSVYYRVLLTSDALPRVKCRLSLYAEEYPKLHAGDEILAEVKLSSARVRYGEETDSYLGTGVFLRGSITGELRKTGTWRYAALYAPQRWSRRVTELAEKAFPEDVSGFQTALLTGDKTRLYEDYPLYYTLSRAGLMHVAAVSGMHVSFFVGFLGLLLPNRRRFGVLMLPVLGCFAALSGFTPSVCRAVFMQSAALLGMALRRDNDPPTSLLAALTLLLLNNPYAALSVSLQLSFGATAGILLFTEKLNTAILLRLNESRLSRALAATVSTSLGAMALTLPLTAVHFGSVSVAAPLTNALCLWLVSALFVGGYLIVGITAVWSTAGERLGSLLAWGDRYVFAAARLITRLPCAAVYVCSGVYRAWFLCSLAGVLLFCLAARLRKRPPRLTTALLLSLIGLYACALYIRQDRKELLVTALDVGQGSSTLIECGAEAVLVDCGGTNTEDYAGETVGYYLLGRERRELSALVLTHLHRDHVNGAVRLLALVRVDTLYFPAGESEELPAVLAAAERAGTKVVTVKEETVLRGQEFTLRLSPPLPAEKDGESGIFVLASRGDWDCLITGDADTGAERRFIERTQPPDIELLIAGHHGSAYASGEYLLDTLFPETAVISVGYNTYGHPAEETLRRFEDRLIVVRRTDLEGNITVKGE